MRCIASKYLLALKAQGFNERESSSCVLFRITKAPGQLDRSRSEEAAVGGRGQLSTVLTRLARRGVSDFRISQQRKVSLKRGGPCAFIKLPGSVAVRRGGVFKAENDLMVA